MPGAATQIFSAEFDAVLARLPKNVAALVMTMGRRLDSFPHYRMTGRSEFRLRVGDYRIIYDFELAKTNCLSSRLGTVARFIGRQPVIAAPLVDLTIAG